ncbi:MAG: hypothetical protein P8124_05900 [Gammaproteobacteria bacterium]
MDTLELDLRTHGERARAALERLSTTGSTPPETDLQGVVRELVAMRGELIGARRAGTQCEEALHRVNGLLSSIFSTEFPDGGLQWRRLCETRDALRTVLENPSV